MIRLEAFDCINKSRYAILQYLTEKELSLSEIIRHCGGTRSGVYHHLKVMKQEGLVLDKDCLKKTIWAGAKRKHITIKRWFLTDSGTRALQYFGGFKCLNQ